MIFDVGFLRVLVTEPTDEKKIITSRLLVGSVPLSFNLIKRKREIPNNKHLAAHLFYLFLTFGPLSSVYYRRDRGPRIYLK